MNASMRGLCVFAIAGLLAASACQAGTTPTTGPSASPSLSQQAWEDKMTQLPLPNKGCFKANYPTVAWRGVTCMTPANVPYRPPSATREMPRTVGGGGANDRSAVVTGLMNAAEGWFFDPTNVNTESGAWLSTPNVSNAYSLQINSQRFTTPACLGQPGCEGWQQFIFSNMQQAAFIQYWLLGHSGACPVGWMAYGSTWCYKNSPGVDVPAQPITSLASLHLRGTAAAGGNDVVYMGTPGELNASNADNVLNLAAQWNEAEFIISGDCCGAQANFNSGAAFTVKTVVHNGTTNAPACDAASFTGETNNLNIVGAPTLTAGAAPAIATRQSTDAGTAGCASASGIGEPHLHPFTGESYDFQATGDFVLAKTSGFAVQARQIPAAPAWGDVAVFSAVATRMDATRVAVCGPDKLVIDGKGTAVDKSLDLPTGVHISHSGGGYVISDSHGNSVRADFYPEWIDVSVGLGSWPADVHGLLVRPHESPNALQASDGTVFNAPVSFTDLYQKYGDSWRVSPADSLLNDCGAATQQGNPTKAVTVRDLPPDKAERARALCKQAGVKDGALLDDCTLDVVVLGDEAVKSYIGR